MSKSSISQTATHAKRDYWMLNTWFWWVTVIKMQKQKHYMNPQIDPLAIPQTTHPIQIDWVNTIELYPIWQFRCFDNSDHQFGSSWVPTQTWTRSDGPECLPSLCTCEPGIMICGHIEKNVLEFPMGYSNQKDKIQTQVVTFSRQPAKSDEFNT